MVFPDSDQWQLLIIIVRYIPGNFVGYITCGRLTISKKIVTLSYENICQQDNRYTVTEKLVIEQALPYWKGNCTICIKGDRQGMCVNSCCLCHHLYISEVILREHTVFESNSLKKRTWSIWENRRVMPVPNYELSAGRIMIWLDHFPLPAYVQQQS